MFAHSVSISASAAENGANEIVKGLLELESDTLYYVNRNCSDHEPAHQFSRSKHLIDNSKIFEVAKLAPKGALLYYQFDAMLPPSELIFVAPGITNMYVRTDAALTDARFYALPTFQILAKAEADRYKNTIFSHPHTSPESGCYFRDSEYFCLEE